MSAGPRLRPKLEETTEQELPEKASEVQNLIHPTALTPQIASQELTEKISE